MTVRELDDRMSSREFVDWAAYFEAEPWGEERADLRMGIMAALTANIHASRGKRFAPGDFMPKFGVPIERDVKDLAAIMDFGARLHNAILEQSR